MKTPQIPALVLLATTSSLAFLPAQLHAQDVGSEEDAVENADGGEIIVRAQRIRGQLDVEQAPILELNEEDIAATGATSIAELIETISPQTTSSRGRGGGGRPVFLVNGIRIGSFRELRSYPPEAIVKVEVMPEEVAQKFGFPPDRRVVNLILKDNYSSREIEAEYEQPGQGGYRAGEGEFTLLRINKGGRTNFNVEVEERTLLTEADRDIIQTPGSISDVAGDPDQALYRSLINDRLAFEVSGNWAKSFLESGSSVSLNTTYEREELNGLSGLNTVILTAPDGSSALRTLDAANPLEVRTTTDTISSAGSWTQSVGTFRLNTTFNASVTDNVSEIDRRGDTSALVAQAAAGTLAIDGALPSLADAGFDTALTETISAEAKSVLRGVLLDLPSGEFSTTFDIGYGWDRITSSDTRSGQDTQLTRGDIEGGVNIVIPLTSRRELFADALGSFTLNGQAGFNHYSDFGTLYDWSAGLNWSPFDSLNLQATYVFNESVPGLSSLGNPQTSTLNVPVFDFVNGETVLATVIAGGNPNLIAETQKDWKFSASWELPFWDNTRLSGEYIVNRSEDVTGSFPALTAEVEAAFPDRILRDAGGTLLSIDQRPLTYANSRSKSLVFGLTTRGSWGAAQPSGRPSGRPQGERPQGAGRPDGSGGPPSAEQREQFMAFRTRMCADDGLEMFTKLVAAVESGEDVSAIMPGFDPERFGRMLDRVRGEDGKVDPARLAQFRERICSMDPSQMRGGGQGGGVQAGGPPQQASGRGGRRGGGAFGGRDGRGRYFVNLNHTIALQSEVQIVEGGFVFDNLAGDALSNTGFARHTTRLEAGAFRGGFGVRLSGSYTGKARINGNAATGTSPLFFGDLATFDVRLFTNLGQVLKQDTGVFKNLRLSLRANNIFDARRRVVDDNGDVPITFQPDLLDPTGRYLGVQLRKLF